MNNVAKHLRWTSLALAVIFIMYYVNIVHAAPSNAQPDMQHSNAIAEQGEAVTHTLPLDEQIEYWIAMLANQLNYSDWQHATWNKYILGPGMHGWVVILQHASEEIGYIVLAATADGGTQVIEYGSGSYPLFSLQTLYNALQQDMLIHSKLSFTVFEQSIANRAIRMYTEQAHAVWLIDFEEQQYIYDAKTGEAIPLELASTHSLLDSTIIVTDSQPKKADTESLDASAQLRPTLIHTLEQQYTMESFDPFAHLHWMFAEPTRLDGEQLTRFIQHSHEVIFVNQMFDDNVTLASPVVHIELWNDKQYYVGIDQTGARNIIIDRLLAGGHFYAAP